MSLYNGSKYGLVIDMVIHCPCAEQTAKEETDKVLSENNAEKGTAKVRISKIPSRWAKPINSAGNKIRNFLKDNTMFINGQFVCPIARIGIVWQGLYGHQNVSSRDVLGGYIGAFNANVDALYTACANGELVAELKNLGHLKDQVESVDCQSIASGYGVDLSLSADLDSSVVKQLMNTISDDLKNQIKTRVYEDAEVSRTKALTEISGSLTNWIEKVLNNLIEKSRSNEKNTKYKYIIDNIKELIEKVPSYNVLNDENISNTVKSIYAKLESIDHKEIAKDDKVRSQVINDAESILAQFKGISNPSSEQVETPSTLDDVKI